MLASEISENPLALNMGIEPTVRTAPPAVQRSLEFTVETRVYRGPRITDGVATPDAQHTAAMMFKKKTQKEQKKKVNDPDLRKKARLFGSAVATLFCLISILVFAVNGVDPPSSTSSTTAVAINLTDDADRDQETVYTAPAPPPPRPPTPST